MEDNLVQTLSSQADASSGHQDTAGMRLLHYAANPLGEIYSVKQDAQNPFKPKGLWLTVDGEDDWKSWCESEGFALDRLALVHEIAIAADANILRITDHDGLCKLSARYAWTPPWESLTPELAGKLTGYLDWAKIASEYQGMIIVPYIWEGRLDLSCHWYSWWDCASGCIWDASAIESVRLLASAQTSSEERSDTVYPLVETVA